MAEGTKLITSNRKARHEYHIDDTFEAGLVLQGTEVKSLREGRANLQDAYCAVSGGEATMYNCHISPYSHGNIFNHEPTRPRKLLLKRKEIEQLDKASSQKGYTIIPLRMYFKNGFAKVEVGLARGKKLYDKRSDIAERDSKRRLDRVLKGGSQE
jgi:SsrA-binding protein